MFKKPAVNGQYNVAARAVSKSVPVVPMHPQMLQAIKNSPKGVLPPGLAKYLAAKKAAKGGGK